MPVVRLAAEHDRSAFDSGEPALDSWLREQAGQSDRKDGARTYVVCQDDRVVGYYSVCTYSVEWDLAPPPLRLGRHAVPAILLARLAVDRAYQGRRVGGLLLADALVRAVRVSEEVGARLLVVHALHDRAAAFYARHGFTPFDDEHRLTLYVTMKDVRRSLEAAG